MSKSTKPASNEHLQWLVKSRSKNQKSAMRIRKLMHNYTKDDFVAKNLDKVIEVLVATNFSLWRAVFLTDLQDDTEKVFYDAKRFIDELIATNTVLFTQDRVSREWTFLYYTQNAQFRLQHLHKTRPDILSDDSFPSLKNPSDKQWWSHCQRALTAAINRTKSTLSA